MMRTLHSILAGAALAVAGYTATAQAQEKPEDKPPTDIWEAAAKVDIEAIKGFLAKDNKIGDQNKNGYSILHIAARTGQTAVAEFALANGANINLPSNSKKTPLHYTAQLNQLAMAKLLVEAKADLEAKDNKGRTALDLAAGEAKRELANYLRGVGVTSKSDEAAAKSIFVAAEIGALDAIKKHLDAGVDVNSLNKHKQTALHFAASAGQLDAAAVLLEAKADVAVADKYQKTALHYSARNGHKATTALLLEKGSAVNAKDGKNKTPLDYAIAKKRTEVIELLRAKSGKTTKELLAADDIFAAAEVSDVESIKKLLAGGADVNAKNKGGYTALHLAAKRGQAAAAAALLEAKADIGLASKSGKTALHYVAYYNGNLDLAKVLLDAGAAVNAKDGKNKTPLDYALSKKRTELAELLRAKSGKTTKELLAADDIFAAAEVGDVESIKKLLAGGADVNAANKQDYTALHMAVRRGQKDAAALLLEKGANVNAERKGKTPLDFAGKNEEIAALLREKGGKTGKEIKAAGSIFSAAQSGLVDAVKTHLAAGVDVNGKNKGGYTALHLAAKKGHVEVAAALLEAKADIGLVSKSGKTALHYVAYYNGNLDLGKLLLDAGAPVNVLDKRRKTPLDYAVSRRNDALVELLLAKGARTGKELRAETDIHYAAANGYADAVKRFIENGGDVNGGDKGGYTALQYAAYNGYIEVVRVLVESKADVNAAANKPKKSALHYAAQKGRKEIALLLLDKGADVNALDKAGRTALDIALRYRRTETGELLRQRGGKLGSELAKPDGGDGGKADPQPLIIDDELDGLTSDGVVLTLLLGPEGPGLSILGWPGEIYLIESSSDLTGWIGVDEVTNDAGRIEWSEPRGDMGAVQFYRVRVLD
jgi:ankyrin